MSLTSHSSSIISAAGFTTAGNLTVSGTLTATNFAVTGNIAVTGAAAITGDLTANTLAVGSSGTVITKILKGTIAVTIAADLAAAEEDISLTVAAATVGDIVILSPLNASMETGVGIVGAWVSANGTIKVRVSNFSGSTLTGSTQNWQYCLVRS